MKPLKQILLTMVLMVAAMVPATAAADDRFVAIDRTPFGSDVATPLPAFSLVAPLPTFTLSFGSVAVDTAEVLPAQVDLSNPPSWLVVQLTGATATQAEAHDHCPSGSVGTQLIVERASPGATVTVFNDPGERDQPGQTGDRQVISGPHELPPTGRPTDIDATICQGV